MEQGKSSAGAVILAIIITAVVVGGGAYCYFQKDTTEMEQPAVEITEEAETPEKIEEPDTPIVEDETETIEESAQFETMKEYVEIAIDMDSVEEPSGLIRVEFGEIAVDVKLEGASGPMYVYADPTWDTGDLEDIQMFYLKAESPAFLMEDPEFEKQEFWHGPFYGKLKLLVQ